MKIMQKTGPFAQGEEIEFEPPRGDEVFVHLGVQIPYRWSIRGWSKAGVSEKVYPYAFSIQKRSDDGEIVEDSFCVNEHGVLEFCDFAKEELVLVAQENLPPETIIDVVYKTVEDE